MLRSSPGQQVRVRCDDELRVLEQRAQHMVRAMALAHGALDEFLRARRRVADPFLQGQCACAEVVLVIRARRHLRQARLTRPAEDAKLREAAAIVAHPAEFLRVRLGEGRLFGHAGAQVLAALQRNTDQGHAGVLAEAAELLHHLLLLGVGARQVQHTGALLHGRQARRQGAHGLAHAGAGFHGDVRFAPHGLGQKLGQLTLLGAGFVGEPAEGRLAGACILPASARGFEGGHARGRAEAGKKASRGGP